MLTSVDTPELFDVAYVDMPDEDEREIDVTLAMMRQVQDMLMVLKNKSSMSHDTVASLESIAPDFCFCNELFQGVSIYSEEAYVIAMEYLTKEDYDVIAQTIGKGANIIADSTKFIFKSSVSAYAFVKEHAPVSGFTEAASLLTLATITVTDGIGDLSVSLKSLDPRVQKKIIALTSGFTGLPIKSEADVNTVLNAIKKSKNSSELMSNLYLPKYSELVLTMYQVNPSAHKALLEYTRKLDSTIAPGIDTNFNQLLSKLIDITASRDWTGLAQLDQPLYEDKFKEPMLALAKSVGVTYSKREKHKRFIGKTYKGIKPLLKPTKLDSKATPTFSQPLSKSFAELSEIADYTTSAVTTLAELSKKREASAAKVMQELRELRSSKTLSESLKNSRSVNKFSNENYGKYLKEMRELAHFVSFLTKLNEDVLTAYIKTFSQLNKLNADIEKYLAAITKLKGEKNAD